MTNEEVELIRRKICIALDREIKRANEQLVESFQKIIRQNPYYRELEGRRDGIVAAADAIRKLEITLSSPGEKTPPTNGNGDGRTAPRIPRE